MINSVAIWTEVSPKDGKFDFNISDLESMFPEGMVDHNVDPICKEVLLSINRNFPSFDFSTFLYIKLI